MARRKQTRGRCLYCRREMTRSGMARHLGSCVQRQDAVHQADRSRRRRQELFHLQVQDAYGEGYWLHLETQGSATLEDLDHYLRVIWLECCGHPSSFAMQGKRYTPPWPDPGGLEDDLSMDVRVDRILRTGLELSHEYDFGSTTELAVKVVGRRTGRPTAGHPIALMARNRFEPPPCHVCGKPAERICLDCHYDVASVSQGYVCEKDAAAH